MSFVEMDWGTRTGTRSDTESILPDIHEQTTQKDKCHSEMRQAGPSRIENMDDTALDVEIKEEVGELFMGISTDERNDGTVFPSGLILIHDQPTMTVTAPGSRTETHVLSYTPIYMAENGSPSYLQTSSPNSSIIRTNNSEIQFLRQAVQPTSSGRLRPAVNFAPEDPLDISLQPRNHFARNDDRSDHILVHNEDPTSTSAQMSMSVRPPLNIAPQDPLEITPPEGTSLESTLTVDAIPTPNSATTSSFNRVEGETDAERRRRQNSEQKRISRERRRQNETPEERTARLKVEAERKRKRFVKETEEQRKARLATDAERKRKYLRKETPEERRAKLGGDAERQRKYLVGETEEQRSARLATLAERQRKRLDNETEEQKTQRRAANAARNRKRLADETPEQRIARLAKVAQCEFCEKSFSRRSLRGHMIREHSKAEDKTYKCDHCEKTFAMQGDCKTHVLTHSKEKRFICDKCGKGYKDNSGLTNHIIFKHRFDEDVQEKYWQE